MKKTRLLIVGGSVTIISLFILLVTIKKDSFAVPAPIPAPNYSSITIDCDELGTSDYVSIEYMGYTSDCEGYTPEWCGDEGTLYFDSNGHVEIASLIGGYSFGYFGVKIVVTKVGANCTYQETKYAGGYHLPD